MLTKDFYRAFEDKHRGSRALIRDRIAAYLPFVLPLKELYPDAKAVDIGCGRGEWLELLQDNDISAQGIDLDEGMLKACRELGLDTVQGNGIEYLKKQPNESITIVSAFHVVEHISFQDLQLLVQEALRVLLPGGLLIMETPNPENIKVATENFYLDPTHINPIPANLLSFLPEFYGFIRTKIVRLQESKELINLKNVNLSHVLEGVSPDYAIVTQKKANIKILGKFDNLFEEDFGLSLSTLSDRFEKRLLAIETKASEAEAKASEAEAKASEAEVRTADALHQHQLVVSSTSWKITKPYRYLGDRYKWFKGNAKAWLTFAPTSRPRKTLRALLVKLNHRISRNKKMKRYFLSILDKFPYLKSRIYRILNANSRPVKRIMIDPTKMAFVAQIKNEVENRKNSMKRAK